MNISEYFKESYQLLLSDQKIDDNFHFFLDNDETLSIPLYEVYIHNSNSEMFLVLDCIGMDENDIKRFVALWEKKVLSFVNFSEIYKDKMKYLKYNITLLILCKEKDVFNREEYQYEAEKSIRICKKIFLYCDDNKTVMEDERQLIPFYFDSIQNEETNEMAENEDRLSDILKVVPEIKKVLGYEDKYKRINDIIKEKLYAD